MSDVEVRIFSGGRIYSREAWMIHHVASALLEGKDVRIVSTNRAHADALYEQAKALAAEWTDP